MYKLLKQENRARRGEFHTVHGTIQTPAFMNVATAAAIKGGLSAYDLREIKCQVMLSNTYHLHLRPGDENVRKLGGIHKFTGWQGPVLTDSGGFQVFSLAKLRNIREEGVTFEYDDQGVPHYTEMVTDAENLSLVQAIAKYTMGGIAPRMVNDLYYWDAVMSFDQQRMVYDAVSVSTTERKVPQSLKYSMEDQDRLTMLMGDIQTYYQETLNAFIMGTKPISELQQFRDTLNSMGLEEAISIMQASYDSYISNNA